MNKVHFISPKTNLTYCGYRAYEVQVTSDLKQLTCKACELRVKFALPVQKPKWD